MIKDLELLLGPGRRSVLWVFVAWTALYGVLSGIAAVLLVPTFAHLVDGNISAVRGNLAWLAVAAVAACGAPYVQSMQ
ncbi:MAG: hypothetical protein L0H93_20260, partial [Nocardioides sp.]|nr:hypothetical protein [Nocardioides sp.]